MPILQREDSCRSCKCRFCGEWLNDAVQTPRADKHHRPPASDRQPIRDPAVAIHKATNETRRADSTPDNAPSKSEPPPKRYGHAVRSFIPLLLITFVVWLAAVRGMQDYRESGIGILSVTLSYCTSPVSITMLLGLGIWFWGSLRQVWPQRKAAFVS